jgi:tetratricopeptide (TPR) repeat protein
MRYLVIASLMLGAAAPAFAQSEQQQLEQCIEKIDVDAESAYQDGLTWLSKGNRPMARQCTALALIALGQEAEGAARLEELANAPDAGGTFERGVFLAQSGNAWLMAGMPAEAVVTLTNALKLRPGDGELFKDRARAHLALKQWKEAGVDLDSAIVLSAADAEAYRMRGHALMKQDRLEEAWADVAEAMKLSPTDVNVVVLRGEVREAMRRAGMEDPAGLDRALEPRTRIVGN